MSTERLAVARATEALTVILSLAVLYGLWAGSGRYSSIARTARRRRRASPSCGTRQSNGELWLHLGMTLLRVAAAFLIAMAIGSAIGIALGLNRLADRLFDPWLILLLNLPALVVIVLAYIWFGLNEVSAIGAVALTKIPNVAVTIREGTRAIDPHADGNGARCSAFRPDGCCGTSSCRSFSPTLRRRPAPASH